MKRVFGLSVVFLSVILCLTSMGITAPSSFAFCSKTVTTKAAMCTKAVTLAVPIIRLESRTPLSAQVPEGLTKYRWKLTAMGDATTFHPIAPRFSITLQFAENAPSMSGKSTCNYYGTTYTMTGQHLHIQAPWETRMACSPGMELEEDYLRTLEQVETYDLQPGRLLFRSRQGYDLLLFQPLSGITSEK